MHWSLAKHVKKERILPIKTRLEIKFLWVFRLIIETKGLTVGRSVPKNYTIKIVHITECPSFVTELGTSTLYYRNSHLRYRTPDTQNFNILQKLVSEFDMSDFKKFENFIKFIFLKIRYFYHLQERINSSHTEVNYSLHLLTRPFWQQDVAFHKPKGRSWLIDF